jgi:hypothetical protein
MHSRTIENAARRRISAAEIRRTVQALKSAGIEVSAARLTLSGAIEFLFASGDHAVRSFEPDCDLDAEMAAWQASRA